MRSAAQIADWHRKYRAANREKIIERRRKYYAVNREKIIERRRKHYAGQHPVKFSRAKLTKELPRGVQVFRDGRRLAVTADNLTYLFTPGALGNEAETAAFLASKLPLAQRRK